MKRILFTAALLSTFMSLGTSTFAQGIPVIDSANLANAVQMFTQLQQQYSQLRAQYDSLNGSRGMSRLLSNPQLRQYLPPEWQTIYGQVQAGNYSGISGSVRSIKESNAVLSPDELNNKNASTKQILDQQRTNAAIGKGVAEDAYKRASDRIQYLQTLVDEIEEANDPKAIMDLQASIQAEQAMLQNEQIKLQLVAQLQAAEERMEGQRSRERFMRTSGSNTARIK